LGLSRHLPAVGPSANRGRKPTADEHLLAIREIHAWLVGFASASTNSNGFMFIGLIGATLTDALSSMWLIVGWIVGDYLAWLVIRRRPRECSEAPLGWPRTAGALIDCALLLYCFGGGLRASIWVNTAQSFAMRGAARLCVLESRMSSVASPVVTAAGEQT
jgi:Na+/proline symporter